MSTRKLALNFETNVLSIVENEVEVDDDETQYVNIPNNNFWVMRVNGVCTSDYEFILISNEEFYQIVNDYIKEFKLTDEEIVVSNNKFKLEDLIVIETNYVFDSDLCSFTLYSISICN